MQRLFEQHPGADLLFLGLLHEGQDLTGIHIFGNKQLLTFPDLVFKILRQLEPDITLVPDLHDLGPHLVEVGAGGLLIIQDMNFSLTVLADDWKESPVAGPVIRQEEHLIRGPGKDTLPRTILRQLVVFGPVRFLLAREEALDGLVGLGVDGGHHLRHLNDPVTLKLFVNVIRFQVLQIVAEPFVIGAEEPEEG